MHRIFVAVLVSMFMAGAAHALPCETMARMGDTYKSRQECVIERLMKVMDSLDKPRIALVSFYVSHRGFPGIAETIHPGMPGQPPKDSLWAMLGYSAYPELPQQVATLSYVPLTVVPRTGLAESFVLIVTLQDMSADGVDGMQIGISATPGTVITGPASATTSGDTLAGVYTITFSYLCHPSGSGKMDPLIAQFSERVYPGKPPVTCK